MGSAASKAPKRAFPKTSAIQTSKQPSAQTTPSAAVQPLQSQQQQPADQAPEGQGQDFLRELKQQGVKDADLGSFLDKLGGAIGGKHVSTLDSKHSESKQPSRQQREEGRLSTAALQSLFQDVHRMEQRDQLDFEALSSRYGIDQSLLERVLRFNRIPAISQAADGRLFGSWHFKS